MPITIFLSVDGEATQIGSPFISGHADDSYDTVQHHIYDQPLDLHDVRGLIAVLTPVIVNEMNSHAYLSTLHTTSELPRTIADNYTTSAHVQERQAMMHAVSKIYLKPTPPLHPV